MTKIKKSKCDKNQKLKILQNSKTKWKTKQQQKTCNNTKKLELGQSSTQSLTNFKNSKCDKIQQLKLW